MSPINTVRLTPHRKPRVGVLCEKKEKEPVNAAARRFQHVLESILLFYESLVKYYGFSLNCRLPLGRATNISTQEKHCR